MRKLIVAEFYSLDGVVEAPENWTFPYRSEDMAEYTKGQILGPDTMIYGRKTYETFAGFWPTQTENQFGFSDKLNSVQKYVVSSTMKHADWNNTSVINGNVIGAVTKLKQQPGGDIGTTGSVMLVQALLAAGLVDELQLTLHPIVVGHGKRLFNDGAEMNGLKFVASKTFSSGVVALTYQPEPKA